MLQPPKPPAGVVPIDVDDELQVTEYVVESGEVKEKVEIDGQTAYVTPKSPEVETGELNDYVPSEPPSGGESSYLA